MTAMKMRKSVSLLAFCSPNAIYNRFPIVVQFTKTAKLCCFNSRICLICTAATVIVPSHLLMPPHFRCRDLLPYHIMSVCSVLLPLEKEQAFDITPKACSRYLLYFSTEILSNPTEYERSTWYPSLLFAEYVYASIPDSV